MTFEELLEWPATIDKLSDAELEALCAPFFPLTRPAKSVTLETLELGFADKVKADLAAAQAKLKMSPELLSKLKKP